jgi:hypothetical protein
LFRTALTDIAHRGVPGLTGFFTGHGKSLAFTGTALAVAGAAIASGVVATAAPAAASAAGSARPQAASPASHAQLSNNLGGQFWAARDTDQAADPLQPLEALDRSAVAHPAATHPAATHPAAVHPAAVHPATVHAGAAHAAGRHVTAVHHAAKPAAHQAPAKPARVHVVKRTKRPTTWQQIQNMVARQTFPKARPGALPAADRVHPFSVSGPQAYMPMTTSRMANATTIVRQALTRHMGLRAAVIAVATAMQESTLENISYGDRDSEGLFQQRPSAGWGSPTQITNPAYAADAFLNALHGHQQADPAWARQPLWENAQAVQNSGFPYAYAKWEAQAAQVVSSITRHMF